MDLGEVATSANCRAPDQALKHPDRALRPPQTTQARSWLIVVGDRWLDGLRTPDQIQAAQYYGNGQLNHTGADNSDFECLIWNVLRLEIYSKIVIY